MSMAAGMALTHGDEYPKLGQSVYPNCVRMFVHDNTLSVK